MRVRRRYPKAYAVFGYDGDWRFVGLFAATTGDKAITFAIEKQAADRLTKPGSLRFAYRARQIPLLTTLHRFLEDSRRYFGIPRCPREKRRTPLKVVP